jgi:hypothetical protein
VNWQNIVETLFLAVATAAIGALGTLATNYISKAIAQKKAQTAALQNEQERKALDNALDDVDNLATVTVQAIEQTTAKELRQAVKDGTANKEELVSLAKDAFATISAAIAPAAQAVITKNLGSFGDYLSNLIEAKVLALKSATNG